MLNIKIYSPIQGTDTWLSMFGMDDLTFSLSNLKDILDKNQNETEITLHINTNGGWVSEGLAIYDMLRTSGKTIFANIEGGCHSIGIVILLSAPVENRTANQHSTALVHEVHAMPFEPISTSDLIELTSVVQEDQNKILDIYVDRTGNERSVLEQLMKDGKELNANQLLEYGFISKINAYNTNFKSKKNMANTNVAVKTLLENAKKTLNSLTSFLKDGGTTNYDFTDNTGTVLFSTEKNDDSIAVNDPASPDGIFTLPDGRQVIIEGGKITAINDAPTDELNTLKSENEALKEELKKMKSTNENAKMVIENAQKTINDLQVNITSNFVPPTRQTNVGKGVEAGTQVDHALIKNEVKEKIKKVNSKK